MAFPWKNEPSPIQHRAMKKAWQKDAYALFHAMGAGKTFTTINLAAARFLKGQIRYMLIICPSPIKSVWGVELKKHCPVEFSYHAYVSGGDRALAKWIEEEDPNVLNVLCIGVEALSQGKAFDHALEWASARSGKVKIVCDESSRIKNPKATRTKKAFKLARASRYRLILTGTPISQGIEDLFAQFWFLDPDIIGMRSYVLFRNMYCIQGGFEGRSIIGYQNVPMLVDRIRDYCDVVTKEEAMPDLPEKTYATPITVDPTPEQKRAMKQLEQDMMAVMSGDELTVSTVMDRLTRYQQICGGFYPYDDEHSYSIRPMEGGNPKMAALLDLCESIYESGEKAIIWARFRPELEAIAENLRVEYGKDSVVEFHGGVGEDDRAANTRNFENNPKCRFMVANAVVGGMGQTWVAATKTVYYSNTFSYEDRMQSEDRNHRRGQHNAVTYYDIVMSVRADTMILQALRKKGDVAATFRDGVKSTDFGASCSTID